MCISVGVFTPQTSSRFVHPFSHCTPVCLTDKPRFCDICSGRPHLPVLEMQPKIHHQQDASERTGNTLCAQKRPPFYFLNNSCQKLTDFNHFWQLNLKMKWLHLTGEVNKSVRFSCQIFSGFNILKIINIG